MKKAKQNTTTKLVQYGEMEITFSVNKRGDVTVLGGTYEGDTKCGKLPYKVRKQICNALVMGLQVTEK